MGCSISVPLDASLSQLHRKLAKGNCFDLKVSTRYDSALGNAKQSLDQGLADVLRFAEPMPLPAPAHLSMASANGLLCGIYFQETTIPIGTHQTYGRVLGVICGHGPSRRRRQKSPGDDGAVVNIAWLSYGANHP